MRASGLINFVLVTGTTACLMGVVTKSNESVSSTEAFEYQPSSLVLPTDSPVTDEPLPYEFKDNSGKPPQFDPKSKLYLENPSNVKTDVNYNPKTGNYDVKQKIGDMDYRPETYMNAKEFKDYQFKKSMRDYWRSRVAADDLNNKPRKSMVPKLQVNSELFDRIFGGNTVDIKPTGTAELIFGLNRNKNFNPAIPQKQQKITNFDFNMRIQLNLIGKIGDKMKVTTNYNTEASFDWENQVKLDYTGYEDEILKKIEAGNVTLPLNSSLISGSQTLFGLKTQLQFGKLMATTVFTQQKGKKQEVNVQGGAQTQTYQLSADNYEANKHYFLGHYFRDNYDTWMGTLPVISTPIVITKVEVYILNINGSALQTRNVVAFEDLGEDTSSVSRTMKSGILPANYAITDNPTPNYVLPSNDANSLYSILTNTGSPVGILAARTSTNVSQLLASAVVATNTNNTGNYYMDPATDYNLIQNARKLDATEFFINARTGFISLNQQISNEQALAVSYQYTEGGKTFQVGEFSDQVPDNSKILICKLLKSVSVNVRQPMWKLMMKNVYSIGAYNLNAQDFKLDVFYNNIETGVDVPYLPFGSINGQQLIRVLNCDKLSVNGDRGSDGVFDFIPNFTILPNNGRVYFPTIEPFGRSLAAKLQPAELADAYTKYIFTELYDSTKTAATFVQNKDRFKIKGTYKSSTGSEIALNALNIPQGSVMVTANGVALVENTDYTVDYTLGRVKIINEGILNSGAQIKVTLESNSLFNVQQKSLWGTRLDYAAGRNLKLGGTLLRYTERPVTQKVGIGDEPVSNVVAGLDFNYKTDAAWLTRAIDKLPFFSTKEMSSITTRGEVAKLFPGNAKAIGKSGNSYIDDFEGSISVIDVRNPTGWFLASIPQGQPSLFSEASITDSILTGINRARFNWYTIDPMFTRSQSGTTPSYYNNLIFSNNMWRQIFETELFPGKTPPNGQQVVMPVLDLGFYPTQRGPYNYDVKPKPGYSAGIANDGTLNGPASRWGGIMRRLETNDFQAANVEYVQFWLMDPYNEDYNTTTDPNFDNKNLPTGDLYIHLGNVSEDILKDGGMVYENGIPGKSSFSSLLTTYSTAIANVPLIPPTVNAFSQDNTDRPYQDVGYDGLDNVAEQNLFRNAIADMNAGGYDPSVKTAFNNDPSTDDYHFFRGDDYDSHTEKTLIRYSRYNNPQGNSPTPDEYANLNPNGGNYSTSSSNTPNIEDVNRDNTLSTTENYYQYHVKISPTDVEPNAVGTNFMVNAFKGTADFSGVSKTVNWYQFKIPITQFENVIGGIEGFNSIRFMRVIMKGFNRPVLLRLARFELVRSDWRRYQFDLRKPGEYIATDDNSTSFDVSAVSLQENGTKVPVNYVMPPDIQQQQNVQTTNLVLQNEQALQMRVCNLKDGDSRAIFKNVDLDTRMYNNILMNVHAEKLNDIPLNDGDLTLFFRIGSDYNNNFYEYEVPLKLTPKGVYDPNSTDARYLVWPLDNEINFRFVEDISVVKAKRNELYGYFSDLNQLSKPFSYVISGHTVTIVGNPNLGTVKSIMVGIRNPKTTDNLSHCAEVWINELRLTDFNNQGGWATTGQVQAKLADLGLVSLAGTYKTPFWGSVDSKIGDRSKETNLNWDVSSSINAGKFFPNKLKVSLPIFYNYGQTVVTPLFNPLDPDVRMAAFLSNPDISAAKKDSIKRQVLDFTERKGFNVTNVRVDGLKRKGAKPMPLDVRNFSMTYAYTEIFKRSVSVESNINKQYKGGLQYSFTFPKPLIVKPFNKMKIFDNKWFALIKDFNLQLLPNSFGASVDLNRTYAALKNRDITGFYAGASDFLNPVLYNKNFVINRAYNLRWEFCKAIKFTYTANNEGRVLEPKGEVGPLYKEKRDSVLRNLMKGGTTTTFRQNMDLNVNLPINKIPILDFSTLTYRYSGTFTWTRMPFAIPDSLSIGNTIQNTNTHNFQANFTMSKLYDKIPYFKKLNSNQNKPAQKNAVPGLTKNPKGGKPASDTAKKAGNENFKDLFEFLARGIMMIKTVSGSYAITGGQGMPNFKPSSQFGGMDFSQNQAPGLLFITGLYDPKIRERSADNDWLVKNQNQTTAYTSISSKDLSFRSSIEPHGSLKIDLVGNKKITSNTSQFMIYDPTIPGTYNDKHFKFDVSTNSSGSFNISTFSFFNSLKDGKDPINSKLFSQFLSERRNVAKQLGSANKASGGAVSYVDLNGNPASYIDGYQDNQQDVLLGAFYNTYSGRKIKNYSTTNIFPKIPIPNWTVSWDGLGKLAPLKKTFRSVTLRHAYRSSYNISGFTNNLLYTGTDQTARAPVDVSTGTTVLNSNFVSYYNVNAATITEDFSPLVKFDFQFVKPGWTANVTTNRNKSTTLNITGPQIIETKGQEYIVGLGYMYPKLKFNNIKIQGKVLESNLTVKVDVSYRRNISVIRRISDGISIPTGGTDIITLRSSADYGLTPNINLRLFYDWIKTKPQTSASFPTSNATGGFSLRINFQ